MNKGELIEAVAGHTGSTKADAGRAVDAAVCSKAFKKLINLNMGDFYEQR
jgi:DNA-binding protein HU-beta